MATDPEKNQIGYAVASNTFYVGIIGSSEPGQAAILCQGQSNLRNGPTALNLIQNGKTLKQALNELKRTDSMIEKQQFCMADAAGNVLVYTGSGCSDWAGYIMKQGYTCQGNILTGPEVLASMCDAFESTEGVLVEHPMAALHAGDATGGDRRGKQNASVRVISQGGGFTGSDVVADLNIYDYVDPVVELGRVTDIAVGYMKKPVFTNHQL